MQQSDKSQESVCSVLKSTVLSSITRVYQCLAYSERKRGREREGVEETTFKVEVDPSWNISKKHRNAM